MNVTRFALLASLLLSWTTALQASVWTDGLTYNGIADNIQDNSVSQSRDMDSNGILGLNDVIVGIIVWDNNTTDNLTMSNSPKWALTVFAAKIVTDGTGAWATNPANSNPITVNGTNTIKFELDASTAAGQTLADLLPAQAAAVSGFASNAIAVTLSGNSATDPVNLSVASAFALIDDTAKFQVDNVIGFAPAAGETNWFEAFLADVDSNKTISITEYNSLVSSQALQIGAESGMFSVLADYTGPGVANYSNVTGKKYGLGLASPSYSGDVYLSNTTQLFTATTGQFGNGWNGGDQSVIAINGLAAVPEPSTVILWGLGCIALVGRHLKRRNG